MKQLFSSKRILAFILTFIMIVSNIKLIPVYAVEETVVYVDGVNGLDTNDGLSDTTPLKTLKAAYGKVPADNVKSTIVVMSELQLAPDVAPYTYNSSDKTYSRNESVDENSLQLDWSRQLSNIDMYIFPEHVGEIVITSGVDGDGNHIGALDFNGKAFSLSGHTTIENIKITGEADCIYARFHKLTLGEGLTAVDGVTYYPANSIYMGIGTNMTYNPDTNKANLNNFAYDEAKTDVQFNMNSGYVKTVYGGNKSHSIAKAKPYDVYIDVNGGKITDLYGSSLGSGTSYADGHNDINITLSGNSEVKNLYGAHAKVEITGNIKIALEDNAKVTAKIQALHTDSGTGMTTKLAETGDVILNLNGSNISIPAVNNGFKHLGLNGSDLTIAGETVEKVDMTDDSTLTFTCAPTNAVNVAVTNNDDAWNTTTALITAPTGTSVNLSLTDAS